MKLDDFFFDKNKKKLVDEILSDAHITRYILGRNECAKKLSALVHIDAFVDDFTDETEYLGKPIIRSSDVNKDSIVVSCSLAIYPHSALTILKETGIEKVIHFLDVVRYSKLVSLNIPFISQARNDIEINHALYEKLYESLSDEISKSTLLDLLNFRKNLDLSYLRSYKVDFVGQYFEDFLKLKDSEVFVDAGGFDGSTSIEFIKRCPNYKSVHIFEPSEVNIFKAKENLKKYQNIHFHLLGLYDRNDTLAFNSEAGSSSCVSEDGTDLIHVDKLDDVVVEAITFIKMDIEGGEAKAIKGMAQHILNDHPRLAISVYHKHDDLWKIPNQILAIRSDYKLYIRHYTEGMDETVMFFMPKT